MKLRPVGDVSLEKIHDIKTNGKTQMEGIVMFEEYIIEYFKFTTKEEYTSNSKVFYKKEGSPSVYEFGDIKWTILPERLRNISIETVNEAAKLDTTIVSFLNNRQYDFIDNAEYCRKLTVDDKEIFKQLIDKLSDEEKESGAVSLDDPIVYGLVKDNEILSVASLWHFGDTLSDIGVLTHPKHRNNGHAESICKYLIHNEDRNYIWRSADNPSSRKLSMKLGFIETGAIHSLVL